MRLTSFAAALGLLCFGTQAQAATVGYDPARLFSDCQQLQGERAYERSATICAAAAEGFSEIAARTRNWAPYLNQAHSLQLLALDQAALSQYRAARASSCALRIQRLPRARSGRLHRHPCVGPAVGGIRDRPKRLHSPQPRRLTHRLQHSALDRQHQLQRTSMRTP
jgi:hypothetical protein